MFSKPLFKQSCKANGVLWGIITAAVSIMLLVVVLVMGSSNIAALTSSVTKTMTKNAIVSEIESTGMNLHYTTSLTLHTYDIKETEIKNVVDQSILVFTNVTSAPPVSGLSTKEQIEATIAAIKQAQEGISQEEEQLIRNILGLHTQGTPKDTIINTFTATLPEIIISRVVENAGENAKTIKELLTQILTVYKGMPTPRNPEAVSKQFLPTALAPQLKTNIDAQGFEEFGFTEAIISEKIANSMILFEAQVAYENDGKHIYEIDSAKSNTIIKKMTKSMRDEMAENGSFESLNEIAQMDVFSLVVGDIFFKIAGILLPMIYIIMTANALIAGQVDSGSMAYTLSTSTKRRTVAFTQMAFLVSSLFAMYLCSTIVGIIGLACLKPGVSTISYGEMALLNLGAFMTLFAISGICFLASCWFNRSKHSMAVGGGISMYFLVATILGLFGSKTFPSMIRIDAMNYFNYTTIITLFDLSSILSGGTDFIWKFAILLGIGILGFIIGTRKFVKKDLPL